MVKEYVSAKRKKRQLLGCVFGLLIFLAKKHAIHKKRDVRYRGNFLCNFVASVPKYDLVIAAFLLAHVLIRPG